MLWHCALPALEASASDSATGEKKKKGRKRERAIGAQSQEAAYSQMQCLAQLSPWLWLAAGTVIEGRNVAGDVCVEGNPLQPTAGLCDQPLLTCTLPCDSSC